MKPFAYQYLQCSYDDIQDVKVFPTLRAAYAYIIARVSPQGCPDIDAYYPDGSHQTVLLDTFKIAVPLNMDALLLEARGMIEADKMAWKKWTDEARVRRKANGQDENAVITITGSPRLCDHSENEIVERLAEERRWRWQTVEEVEQAASLGDMDGWTRLESGLEKED